MNQHVVLLVGGVGGAKLALGLTQILEPDQLTIIVNTGDDFWHYGLRICPDLDTVMYTLSGLVDPINGWGIQGDTRITLNALNRFGESPWFQLGDQDLATHLLRAHLLRKGQTLSQITAYLVQQLGIQHAILPMTDTPVATMIDTIEHGELEFQEYFVRHRWQPTVKSLRFDGIERARITPEIENALALASKIIIGPSNPWLSIAPILHVPGMREALLARDVPRIAVTPIVGGKALKGPAAKLMVELGYTVTSQTVAEYYGDVINGFVYDERDEGVQLNHLQSIAFNTVMNNTADKVRLANAVLNWTGEWML